VTGQATVEARPPAKVSQVIARRASLPKPAVRVAKAGSYWVAAIATPVTIQAAPKLQMSGASASAASAKAERSEPADITIRPP
jgi:hypothetical protein